jgi:hypothetical protein
MGKRGPDFTWRKKAAHFPETPSLDDQVAKYSCTLDYWKDQKNYPAEPRPDGGIMSKEKQLLV